MPPEQVQWCRYYWQATMPDGKTIPQFMPDGRKIEWKDLPAMPTKVALVPFSKTLALKVRSTSKIPALDIDPAPKPVELEDFGSGIMAGQDQQTYTNIQTVECTVCHHTWPFDPCTMAQCPKCYSKDDWFCVTCQKNQEPLILAQGKPPICPDCKSLRGETRGLKRIMKFLIRSSPPQYVTNYWIRSPPVEMRINDNGKVTTRPWNHYCTKTTKNDKVWVCSKPLPRIITALKYASASSKESTTAELNIDK